MVSKSKKKLVVFDCVRTYFVLLLLYFKTQRYVLNQNHIYLFNFLKSFYIRLAVLLEATILRSLTEWWIAGFDYQKGVGAFVFSSSSSSTSPNRGPPNLFGKKYYNVFPKNRKREVDQSLLTKDEAQKN